MNSRVSAYAGICEALAAEISRYSSAIQVGAEYDDLRQEGLINVWQSLDRGVTPSTEVIKKRMLNWVRHMGALKGVGSDQLRSYELALPLDDFRMEAVSEQADQPIPEPDGSS